MKKLTKTVSVISILVLALASTMVSAAVDTKIYPGSVCQPYHGSQSSILDTQIDRVQNMSSVNAYISCPLIKDTTSNFNGIKVVVSGYRSISRSTQSMRCTLYNSFKDYTYYISSNSTNNIGRFDMTLRLSTNVYKSNYSVLCHLTPGSSINQIVVDEY